MKDSKHKNQKRSTRGDVADDLSVPCFIELIKKINCTYVCQHFVAGDIYLAPGEHLDRETKSTYQLKIAASDKGIPRILTSTAHVDVVVDDVNDCRPKFMSTRHVVTVSFNATVL